jgi:hypothetical protein
LSGVIDLSLSLECVGGKDVAFVCSEKKRCVKATQSCVGNLIEHLLGHLWLEKKRKKVISVRVKKGCERYLFAST